MNEGKRFSVYFYADQLEYMDKEAERLGVSRSKYIEMKTLPKELQKLEKTCKTCTGWKFWRVCRSDKRKPAEIKAEDYF